MLVPIGAVRLDEPRYHTACRRNVAFIAQLIATVEQDPQTRNIRRASAADVISAYGVSGPIRTGDTLSKVA